MARLSGGNVNGQRHDGLDKEIRSVPRKGLGGYCDNTTDYLSIQPAKWAKIWRFAACNPPCP